MLTSLISPLIGRRKNRIEPIMLYICAAEHHVNYHKAVTHTLDNRPYIGLIAL